MASSHVRTSAGFVVFFVVVRSKLRGSLEVSTPKGSASPEEQRSFFVFFSVWIGADRRIQLSPGSTRLARVFVSVFFSFLELFFNFFLFLLCAVAGRRRRVAEFTFVCIFFASLQS